MQFVLQFPQSGCAYGLSVCPKLHSCEATSLDDHLTLELDHLVFGRDTHPEGVRAIGGYEVVYMVLIIADIQVAEFGHGQKWAHGQRVAGTFAVHRQICKAAAFD